MYEKTPRIKEIETMKITSKDYETMKAAILPLASYIKSHRAFIVEQGKAKDIEMRLRWDMAHAAKLTPFICETLYKYVDDRHIDTALKAIMKEIETI